MNRTASGERTSMAATASRMARHASVIPSQRHRDLIINQRSENMLEPRVASRLPGRQRERRSCPHLTAARAYRHQPDRWKSRVVGTTDPTITLTRQDESD